MHKKVKKGALYGALLIAFAGGTGVSARAQGYCGAPDSSGTVSCTVPSGTYSSMVSIPGNAAAEYDVSNLGTFNVNGYEFALQVGGSRAPVNQGSSIFSVTSDGAITLSGAESPTEALQVLSMGGNSTSSAGGGTAGAVTLTIDAPVSLTSSTGPAYAALAQTIGGQGNASTGKNVNGTAGGFAGDVTATISDTTVSVQVPDNLGGAALFAGEVGSIGGDGGSASDGPNDNAAGGAGGGTGTLTLTVSNATLTATGAGALGISAGQTGGAGGWGGNSAVGGAGGGTGAATVTLDNASVSASGADAVSVGQTGGAGGDASQGGNSSIANAGNGGSTGSLTAVVTDSTIDAPSGRGLVLTQAGGTGGNGPNGSNSADNQWANAGNGGSTGGISLTFMPAGATGTTINTTDGIAPGVVAKAIGGAGGATYQGGGGVDVDTDVGNGGAGGSAGSGGEVLVQSSGTLTITTQGDTSPGIAAIGQGGQGGSAGEVVCSSNCHPGAGGGGGDGGRVEVELGAGATITTAGGDSPAVLAQSLGGNGGAAGGANAGFGDATGLTSGAGGYSGPAVANLASGVALTTKGAESPGLLVQSVGGLGGGNAAVQIAAPFGDGTGTNGGAGGSVDGPDVISSATITTSGDSSRGIMVQELSGPGGPGGLGASGVGGSDGGAGGASGTLDGTMTVENFGTITTEGAGAQGILVQAIGGGGGAGGSANGFFSTGGAASVSSANGGDILGENSGAISTSGAVAAAIVVQSIGGGGGDGGASSGVFYNQGGNAGAGGNGGDLTVELGGSLATAGTLAHGLLAQSIGGSGGSGGNAVTEGAAPVAYAIGGSGGGGGSGGTVSVSANDATVRLTGSGANGLVAQSVGGGGGAGGAAYALDVSLPTGVLSFAYAAAVGGSGGAGGSGNDVTVTTANSTISTGHPPPVTPDTAVSALPVDDIGILVQSIGGGGGAGGGASAEAIAIGMPSPPETPSAAVTVTDSVGGTGGSGGSAVGTVSASLEDGTNVTTAGAGSIGLLAQSVGGGGGQGGDSSTFSGTIGSANKYLTASAGTETVSLNFAVGAAGGSGGSGGGVTISLGDASNPTPNDPVTITTTGDYADGVLVQSIGGGGGNAGAGSSQMHTTGAGSSIKFSLDLGAKGGSGNVGGSVSTDLYPESVISTAGSGAVGLLAQSIGGGGGNSTGYTMNLSGLTKQVGKTGASSKIQVGVNGTLGLGAVGGAGNDAGSVTALSAGSITTLGDDAPGVLLQSIGGGGGVGGSPGQDAAPSGDKTEPVRGNPFDDAEAGEPRLSPGSVTFAANTAVSLGGSGGAAGNGGAVTLTEQGTVQTSGDYAPGVIAQSIGGGGGRGGTAIVGTQDNTVQSVLAQLTFYTNISLGANGGGGTGGNGEGVDLFLNGAGIATGVAAADASGTGFESFGVLAQSIGGGGGTAADGTSGANGIAIIGSGSSGASGNGGDVSIQQTGGVANRISTTGDYAIGLAVQSIGGGGGVYGAGSSAVIANTRYSGTVTLKLGSQSGTATGNGGSVTIRYPGLAIATSGNGAFGVLAQSIGAGGGFAAVGGAAVVSELGAVGGGTGNGGSVTVDLGSNGSIVTSGVGAHGVVAQSIGGGGGVAVLAASGTVPSLTLNRWYNGSSYGTGGAVSVETHGPITVTGAGAFGILAQSIGGGGGLASTSSGAVFAGSTNGGGSQAVAGNVSVTAQGSIKATGANGVAIFAEAAQTEVDVGAGSVTVDLEGGLSGGTVEGGSGAQGYGVWVDGGGEANALIVGSGVMLSALSANPVNYTGNFFLNTNNGGEVSGDSFNLGGGTFTNRGRLVLAGPAGSGAYYGPATLNGNLVQTASGEIHTDVDFAAAHAGRLVVTGNAMLGGRIVPHVATVLPNVNVPVMVVDGVMTGMIAGSHSTLYAYDTHDPPSEITLSARALGFAPAGFGIRGAAAEVASYLGPVFATATTPELGRLFAELGNLADAGPAGYIDALHQLSPGGTLAFAARARRETAEFGDALLNCRDFVGARTAQTDKACLSMEVSGDAANESDAGGYAGFTGSTLNYRVVGEGQIAPGWWLGGGFGYAHSWLSGDYYTKGDGDAGYLGASLTREWRGWRFSGALLGSIGSYTTSRTISIPGFESVLNGKPDVDTEAAALRADYTFGLGRTYVRPSLSLDLVRVHAGAFRTTGENTVGLAHGDSSNLSATFAPDVEFGIGTTVGTGLAVQGYLTLGASLPTNAQFQQPVRFEGAALAAGSYDANVLTDGAAATVGAGVRVLTAGNLDVRLAYQGAFSGRLTENSGMLVGSLHF